MNLSKLLYLEHIKPTYFKVTFTFMAGEPLVAFAPSCIRDFPRVS